VSVLTCVTRVCASEGAIYVPGGQNERPIPISISGFTGEVDQAIRFDLYVEGFAIVPTDQAQYELTGSNNGTVQGHFADVHNKSVLVNKAYRGAAPRRLAHALADDIVQSFPGRKGVAQTQIAFKGEKGSGTEIYISDYDGYNVQAVTEDHALVAAPCWVPGRKALFYTSYKLNAPDVYSHDLASGHRRSITPYSGSNMSPAVSPDGSKVAMILSKDGWPDLYVCNADGSGLVRLTKSPEDESSPCWSHDGKWICFAAKLKERRTLCKVPASGGQIQRIATVGVLNPTEPDWSPDGKTIVFTAMMGGFEICTVPSEGGTATELVSGEDPCWAPNSRTVVYSRRQGGHSVLSILDVPTKQTKDVSRISGLSSQTQPSWAR
jgi:TolB protein